MEIEEIKKIKLNKGGVLAVRLPDDIDIDQVNNVRKVLESIFPDNKVTVYCGEVEFTNIGPDKD